MLESAVKTIVEKFPDVTVLVNSNVGVASEFQDVGIHLPEDLCSKWHPRENRRRFLSVRS